MPGGVRIMYTRAGFEAFPGHIVRSRMEATVCRWLLEHNVAHRHGSEVFTVPSGRGRPPAVYVPDIVLHDPAPDGRRILIEPHQVNVPREGGTRLLAAFRRVMKSRYAVIMIARRADFLHLVRGSYDVLIDVDRIESLLSRIPVPVE